MLEKPVRYHHGELPEMLMALALQHIEADGTEKLSLRALAREAGVSPTAPYSHFSTKTCLLAAIATQSFQQLHTKLLDVSQNDVPLADLIVQLGMAYISFAVENPTAYKLMFSTIIGDFSRYDSLYSATESVHAIVTKVIDRIRIEESIDADLELLSASMWSLVHGMSSLLIDESKTGIPKSGPQKSMRALQRDTESALRLMMGNLFSK